VKNLLHDADATVLLRASQGILAGHDKAAVPTLVSLLDSAPLELSQRAEELLQRAAGNSAPSLMLGDSEINRKRCVAAWNDWSKSNLEKLNVANRDVSLPFLSINSRAKDLALRWFRSLAKRDLGTWKKSSDVPFTLTMGGIFLPFNNREELDQWFFDDSKANAKMAEMKFAIKDVSTVDQYLRSTTAGLRGTNVPQLSVVLFHKVYL